MIKRNGVEVMNARSKNVSIAKETLAICKAKQYTTFNGVVVDLTNSLDDAIASTKLYKEDIALEVKTIFRHPVIEVVNETTAQAAVRLLKDGKQDIAALNFASARNQGGGFLSGAMAQEEDLCRCSGLYPCLKSKPVFYNQNILCDDCYYTNNIIYSKDVPFFRNEFNLLLEQPFPLSIISSPAPNLNAVRGNLATVKEVDELALLSRLLERAVKILQVAHVNGHSNIILGAWGCGAFGNDPVMVATVFEEALKVVPTFTHVCFAVYDTRTPPHLFESFNEIFK